MLGGIGNKKMQKMMKKLNMDVEELPADEVIIKSEDKTIRITNPQVMIANMMGKEVYQVTGDVEESASEEDIQMVMDKTGKDRDTVLSKLRELDNDLAQAIMELKEIEKE